MESVLPGGQFQAALSLRVLSTLDYGGTMFFATGICSALFMCELPAKEKLPYAKVSFRCSNPLTVRVFTYPGTPRDGRGRERNLSLSSRAEIASDSRRGVRTALGSREEKAATSTLSANARAWRKPSTRSSSRAGNCAAGRIGLEVASGEKQAAESRTPAGRRVDAHCSFPKSAPQARPPCSQGRPRLPSRSRARGSSNRQAGPWSERGSWRLLPGCRGHR